MLFPILDLKLPPFDYLVDDDEVSYRLCAVQLLYDTAGTQRPDEPMSNLIIMPTHSVS